VRLVPRGAPGVGRSWSRAPPHRGYLTPKSRFRCCSCRGSVATLIARGFTYRCS
jgi:hypothetical protein